MRLSLSLNFEFEPNLGGTARMAKEWISALANEIKSKDHEAAKAFARLQHENAILQQRVPVFCEEFLKHLAEDCSELDAALAGDPTASRISVARQGLQMFQVNRANFPYLKVQITWHPHGALTVNMVKAAQEEKVQQRTVETSYRFQVSQHDGMTLHEANGAQPKMFEHPADFAKHLMEQFFSV